MPAGYPPRGALQPQEGSPPRGKHNEVRPRFPVLINFLFGAQFQRSLINFPQWGLGVSVKGRSLSFSLGFRSSLEPDDRPAAVLLKTPGPCMGPGMLRLASAPRILLWSPRHVSYVKVT